MKRIISLLLAVSMVLSMCVTAFAAAAYPDLKGENQKYAAAVDALTELKVVNGFPDGEFKPNNELTRAELAKMLVICLGLGDQVDALSTRTVFSDVPATHWAAGYINAAAQSKVIVGYPDGRFQPEKNVSYAEAFTMALRALGYGNVVEAEGTWPTAYMLKAVELELTDDMVGEIKPAAASLRGNTAILLWNMLRTPMWRITEESETNGMTLSDRNGRIMLNVKFPDYLYLENVYLDNVNVTDKDEVKATVCNGWTLDEQERNVPQGAFEAEIRDVDLTELVIGMKVTTLIKDYKDEDKAKFLTLTPENTIVAGFMSELKRKDDKVTFEVDGAEYRFENAPAADAFALEEDVHDEKEVANYYLIFEAEGKKVKNWQVLPLAVEYAETQSDIDSIDEDALVIVDGEWGSREDMEPDCVYTEVDVFDGDSFYVVGSKETGKTFGIMFAEEEDWDDGKSNEEYVTLDEEDVRVVVADDEHFSAWYQQKNNKQLELEKLEVKLSDNDYTDCDVDVYSNYLGVPVRLHFGEVDKNSKNAGFYAVTSNGAWGEGSREGRRFNIGLVGQDGVEDDYVTATTVKIDEVNDDLTSNTDVYREQATFVWAKFDDNNEEIKTLVELRDDMTSGDPELYTSKYDIVELKEDALVDGKKLGNTEYTVAASAYFYEATAVTDDDNNVTGFEVEVTNKRDDYDGYTIPAGSLLAIENGKVKYVFIRAESDSKLVWGKVDAINYNKETVTIVGESQMKLNDKSEKDAAKGDLVGYTTNKAGDKIKIIVVVKPENLSDDELMIVDGNVDDDDREEGIIPVVDGDDYDKDDVEKQIKKYKVVKVTLKKDSDGKVSINSVETMGECGFDQLEDVINDWDRFVIDEENRVIFVFHGVFDKNAELEDGMVSKKGAAADPDPEPEPETSGDPEPETSGDPEPETSGDPEPETSGDPEPETSGDPEPDQGPNEDTSGEGKSGEERV